MRVFTFIPFFLVASLFVGFGEENDPHLVFRQRVQGMTDAQLFKFSNSKSLSKDWLQQLSIRFSAENLKKETAALWSPTAMSYSARPTDDETLPELHSRIKARLQAMERVKFLGALKEDIFAPVPSQHWEFGATEPPHLQLGTEKVPLFPAYPNGIMPSLVPQNGLAGQLVDVGKGEWDDFKGKNIEGAIILLDYSGVEQWQRCMSLGASAVIVIQDRKVNRSTSEKLYCSTPIPFPRFVVSDEVGKRLRTKFSHQRATILGGHRYEKRTTHSMFAILKAPEMTSYRVKANDLLERIASESGLPTFEVTRANPELAFPLQAGEVIALPERQAYVVRAMDLAKRIATQMGCTIEELIEANSDQNLSSLRPEDTLQIPRIEHPLVLIANLDATSAVPDLPHGMFALSNLTTALLTFETLAQAPEGLLRRDVVLALMDGDSLGGMGSRGLAENLLIDRYHRLADGLQPSAFSGTDQDAKMRESAIQFLETGTPSLSDDTVQWLSGWMVSKIEDVRVQIAERRVEVMAEVRESGLSVLGHPDVEDLERQIAHISHPETGLRAHLEKEYVGQQDIQSFWQQLSLQELGGHLKKIKPDILIEKMKAELKLVVQRIKRQKANAVTLKALVDELHLDERGQSMPSLLGFRYHLGDESTTIGIAPNNFYRGTRVSKQSASLAPQFSLGIAYATIEGDWKNPWAFATDGDKSLFPITYRDFQPMYTDMWTVAKVSTIPMMTVSDQLSKIDSPRDTPEYFNFKNFAAVARTSATMISLCVEFFNEGNGPQKIKIPQFGRVGGRALTFNLRSGIDAQEPVADVMMSYPAFNKQKAMEWNSSTHIGMRLAVMRRTGIDGRYLLPVESLNYARSAMNNVNAHYLDPELGLVTKVMTRGPVGTQVQKETFSLLSMQDVEKSLVMTEVYPFIFTPGVDPVDYRSLGERNLGVLEVIDAIMDGEPKYYGHDLPSFQYAEPAINPQVVYGPPGRHFRFFWKTGRNNTMLLIGPAEEDPKGKGYLIGPTEDEDGFVHRNLVLSNTPWYVAKDMMARSTWRYEKYESKGIKDQQIKAMLDRAEEQIALADRALKNKDWQSLAGSSREAWGLLINAYPKLMTLGREAIFSLIVMMALMVPCSWFLERLLVGSKAIVHRLIGMVLFFCAAMLFYSLFHPALQIIHSAFIVVVAFVMILISVIVLFISYQRFTVLMQRATASAGEVKAENITFSGTVATAMNLGINNLRKRKSRTLLTSLTVSALTFSIISFVSVKGSSAIHRLPQNLDADIEGKMVDAMEPNYEGLLFRGAYWAGLSNSFADAVKSEFGRSPQTEFLPPLETTQRGFYLEVEGGNNADRDGVNQIQVRRSVQGDISIIKGLMTFEPEETKFSALNQAVNLRANGEYAGTWFSDEHTGDHRFVTILPSNTAEQVGVSVEELLTPSGDLRPLAELPTVAMQGRRWSVIGVLDVAKADRIRDINGKSLAMIDFLRSAFTTSVASSDLSQEPDSYHISWDKLALVPHNAAGDVDAKLKSLAVRFPQLSDPSVQKAIDAKVASGLSRDLVMAEAQKEREDFMDERFRDIAMRLNRAMYAHRDGDLALVSSSSKISIGGLAKIIVPVILCVLIVFNTMMGTVDERKGEVVMLGSVGLSPGQISLLLLAESLVYSVIGIILGTGGGLIFSALSSSFSFSDALSFNFTSLISMALALGTGLVVIVATLIPARKAAALASPSGMMAWTLPDPVDGKIDFQLPFTLTRGNAVGMTSFFKNFLNNHTDSGSEGFNCRNILLAEKTDPAALEISADMWLAPYDLDVAQKLILQIRPSTSPGVFGVWISLERRSGSEDAWIRTNYGFMDQVRLQFLLWRNLNPERRGDFIQEGVRQFKGQKA